MEVAITSSDSGHQLWKPREEIFPQQMSYCLIAVLVRLSATKPVRSYNTSAFEHLGNPRSVLRFTAMGPDQTFSYVPFERP